MNTYNWQPFLRELSESLLKVAHIREELPPEVVASGWLGYPGATEGQIQSAERRLGTALPPSYREFLKVSNGWRMVNTFIYKLWSTEEVDWFRVRNQEWIDIESQYPFPVPDEFYFVYGEGQTPDYRVEYLPTLLEVSDVGDVEVFLLNPQVVTPDGEWEAWFLASWIPGARRYRSFWDMMHKEYDIFLRLRP